MKNKSDYSLTELEDAALILKVLAHPARLHIIRHLGRYGQLNAKSLQQQLPLAQAVLSHHLIKMRDRNILRCNRKGRESYYYLADPQLVNVLDLLMPNQ